MYLNWLIHHRMIALGFNKILTVYFNINFYILIPKYLRVFNIIVQQDATVSHQLLTGSSWDVLFWDMCWASAFSYFSRAHFDSSRRVARSMNALWAGRCRTRNRCKYTNKKKHMNIYSRYKSCYTTVFLYVCIVFCFVLCLFWCLCLVLFCLAFLLCLFFVLLHCFIPIYIPVLGQTLEPYNKYYMALWNKSFWT